MSSEATELSIYIGLSITAILYGVLICVTFCSVYLLIYNRKSKEDARRNNFYIAYSLTLFALLTFAFATNVLMGQLMWIVHRDYPGGPFAYFNASVNSWFETLGTSTDVVANIMSDALLVYRCYIIWSRSLWILIPLSFVYLSSIAFSILTTLQSALPNSSVLVNSTNFFIPWIAFTCGLNFIVTGLIVFRILSLSHEVRGTLSAESHKVYISASAILIESALPFSILGIIFAVYAAKNEPPQQALSFIWGTFFALSPQLIILRVAMGRAWSANTEKKMTASIVFNPPVDNTEKSGANLQDCEHRVTGHSAVDITSGRFN